MKHAEKGFTLIEIMIVVAIIAILAAIAIPNFIAYRKTAQGNACVSNMSSIVTACEALEIKDSAVTSKDTLTMTDLYKEDGSGFLKKSLTCPAGGTYTIARDKGAWTVTCSKHNADGTDKSEAQPTPEG